MKIKQSIIVLVLSIVSFNILLPSSIWARRIKKPEMFFTAAVIERNVSEWKDCGLPVAVISEIDGQVLKQPVTIVKKPTTITTFYRHLAAKLLGEYFISRGVYRTEHIPALIARGEGCYYYLYSEGLSHYPLEVRGKDIELAEWDEFNAAFKEAGFFTDIDITLGDNAELSNNIILNYSLSDAVLLAPNELTSWKRIDFAFSSLPSPLKGALISNELWSSFLEKHSLDLERRLGSAKFELLNICIRALENFGKLPGSQEQRFEALFSQYQRELLRDYLPE